MSKDQLTFYRYVTNYNTDNINKFLELFGNTIEEIPDKVVSSKYIIKILNINSNEEFGRRQGMIYFRTFRNVFNDYFKLILN